VLFTLGGLVVRCDVITMWSGVLSSLTRSMW